MSSIESMDGTKGNGAIEDAKIFAAKWKRNRDKAMEDSQASLDRLERYYDEAMEESQDYAEKLLRK